VLDEFDEIPFCIGYRYRGAILEDFPADARVLAEVEPVYKNLPGWKTSTEGVTEWSDLPVAAQDYLKSIAEFTETPIKMVSTGAERDQTVRL
jgi:adenylosuccinate synthase